jgi:glycosyltransferase involved in cell wall biosynthesis
MVPNDKTWGDESGIRRVVEAYIRYLPDFGWKVVNDPNAMLDIVAVHAGLAQRDTVHVAHTHGLYWTADYDAATWEWGANQRVLYCCRAARKVTVPSEWVAETFRRDMRIDPVVIGHGIDLKEWGEPIERERYILWNKNRAADVCNPLPVGILARRFPQYRFVTTFAPPGDFHNIRTIGVQPHLEMRNFVKRSGVYLATTKETFGIGTLEAMASGVPILGYAHGGILDMVKHGVNGYLARPRDEDDLAEGLAFCMKHAAILGDNGREIAKSFTWEKQVAKVAQTYNEAVKVQAPSAAIIIPTFNYGEKVGRAIESAVKQTYPLLNHIIVVDDGTEDKGLTHQRVDEWHARDPRVVYVKQDNQGVAIARNTGIEYAWKRGVKYVACLDADDWLDERFLAVTIPPMEERPDLGITYTGLHFHKPDGTHGISSWPGDWDFARQLLRANQVPTACTFRVEMWRRLGGYRQRYAPMGAGSEDAEFWLRSGAYGWEARKVTNEGLFHYSWMTGGVTGNAEYREVDWLAWHPWAGQDGDGKHPMASHAPARRYSHPVRQYDEPMVSVVIPVGPKHQKWLWDAFDSLEAQTFRRWEVLAVMDNTEKVETRLRDAYPYVRWLLPGKSSGAGHARNLGAAAARAPFLLFLDADDYLLPQALEMMLEAWRIDNAIVYSDYRGRAEIHDPTKLAADLQERVYDWNRKTNEAVIGYRAFDFDCERALEQPEEPQPWLWCNVTCLIPKAWHDEIGGFDEVMKSWEDVEYHYRMVRAGKCYIRVAHELLVYRFSTGSRRETGLQEHRSIVEYIRAKWGEEKAVGCGCKGNGRSPVSLEQTSPDRGMVLAIPSSPNGSATMSDADYSLAKYTHPNTGLHSVVGGHTGIKYGYRGGGEVFLVHRDDIQAQTHLFTIVDEKPTVIPPLVKEAAPEPVAIATTPEAAPKRKPGRPKKA